jgi:hypothetical protein
MMGGAPEGVMEEIFGLMSDNSAVIVSYETFFEEFGRAYDEVAMRYMNVQNGGQGGRPLPDMETVFNELGVLASDKNGDFVNQWNDAVVQLISENQ